MKKHSLVVVANTAIVAALAFGSTISAQELVVVENVPLAAGENGEANAPVAKPQLDTNNVPSKESLILRHQKNAETSLRIRQMKAQARAAQRQARIDSAKWYGHSPLRPTVSSLPYFSTYNARVPAYPYGYTWSYHSTLVPAYFGPGSLHR
jgi:hypothetical protein